MDDAFAESMQMFYEQLLGNTSNNLEDAFGTVLLMANMHARLAANTEYECGGLAHGEILQDCERKLGGAIVAKLEELVNSRNNKVSDPPPPRSPPPERDEKAVVSKQQDRKQKSGTRSPSKGKRGKLSAQQLRDRIQKADEKFKRKKQDEVTKVQTRQETLLKRQLEREAADLGLLRRGAQLCQLLESLRIIISRDKETKFGDEMSAAGLGLFSKLVCAGLGERFALVLDELKSHRDLLSVAEDVQASDDDPYLKALSSILKYADSLIEKLMLGEYAVTALQEQEEEQEEEKSKTGLATSNIVRTVEEMTSSSALIVLDAFYEDKKLASWTCASNQSLDEDATNALDQVLNDTMYALTYCGHFCNFLTSLGVLDPKSLGTSLPAKQLDLASTYIQMESTWMTRSLSKAEQLATVTGEGCDRVISIVDDVWFIMHEKAFARSVYTQNSLACSSIANHIARLLEDDYSNFVMSLFSVTTRFREEEQTDDLIFDQQDAKNDQHDNDDGLGKNNGPRLLQRKSSLEEDESQEDAFAAMLDSDVQGLANLGSNLLIAINTAEKSANKLAALAFAIRYQFQHKHPESLFQVEMALQGLQGAADSHDQARHQAIRQVVDESLAPALRQAVAKLLQLVTYDCDHTTFERYEREDPFVKKLLNDHLQNGRNLIKCRHYLTKTNFCFLLDRVASIIAESWEKQIATQIFNDLGGIRLNLDVRAIKTGLAELYYSDREKQELADMGIEMQTSDELLSPSMHQELLESSQESDGRLDRVFLAQQIANHFARIEQMAFLLELDKAQHVEVLPYQRQKVLSQQEIKSVLKSRKIQDCDVDALDVSSHACASVPV